MKRKIKVTLPSGQQMFYEVEDGKPNSMHAALGATWESDPIEINLPKPIEQALIAGDVDTAISLLKQQQGFQVEEI
jgi:hypothetical protein